MEPMQPSTSHGDLPKKLRAAQGRAKTQWTCCGCTAQGDGKQGKSGVEMLELQVCCGAELCDIFMLPQCVCRCVGDV